MKYLTLANGALRVSEICLGTMTWGTQNTEAEGHAQMDQALAAGVNFLDTAEMYPVNPVSVDTIGNTERIIGNWIARTGRRSDWVIATKIAGSGAQARGGEPITGASIARALEASLTRLQTDVIDIYQFHWPNRGSYQFRQNWGYDPSRQDRVATLANMQDCIAAVGSALAAGKIRNWGLSNESAWGMATWLRLADAAGVARPITVQNEYSLLCRLWDTDLAELAHNEDLTLLAFSPLAAGLLSGKYQGDVIPARSRRSLNPELGGRIGPRVWAAVDAYLNIARQAGLDPAQMAVAWTLTRPARTLPIIGATTPAQLATALGGAELVLSANVLAAIQAAHRAHPMPY
jgi:aryl-alcohol dehydrogenase-like predicted oxidoreductase